MKKILFLLLFLLFLPAAKAQYTIGADKFELFHGHNKTDWGSMRKGQFFRNSAADTVWWYDGSALQVWYPRGAGGGGATLNYITDSSATNYINVTYSSGHDTAYIRVYYADSAGNSHKSDTLYNLFQNVWKRNTTGEAYLVNLGDTVLIGSSSVNPAFNGKLTIRMINNSTPALVFAGDSGSVDLPFLVGRMNNQRYWQLKHFSANDHLQLSVNTPPSTTNTYLGMTTTGVGIDGVALDVFHVFGNTSIGSFSAGNSGSGNLRVRGMIGGGLQAAEVGSQVNHILEQSASNQDIVDLTSTTITDSSTGSHEYFFSRNALFTSASNQAMYTCTINQFVTYNFEVTLIENPSSVDSGYVAKKIYCTARNRSGTIDFDTTTAFYHQKTTTLSTGDLIVTASGNTLTFNAVGSATRQVRASMTGWRRFIK